MTVTSGNYPLKWEDLKTGLTVIWRNAEIREVEKSTFDIPDGYSELTEVKNEPIKRRPDNDD